MLKTLARSIAILSLSWALTSANVQAQCEAPPNLNGQWHANDGGSYEVRITGTNVFWTGKSADNGKSWTNVFKGTLKGGVITGEWADVGGRNHGSGTLTLRVRGTDFMERIRATGSGFAGTRWSRGGCPDTQ
ncbi:hypothetical protein LuPra_04078 [Luteitalea pratensis]|jgi:hypothetical protein|uniref:Uncharacterized protein n=1 Tax=Luteitalea pratensis TaxID=1855912 RepID=A0A143PQG2_LUTPR|nr:hypothetical protein [Luteitalea pratensis]AMY10835.1 hypothetical protein LuPra_04078 [Luteitalea pratensis]